MTDRELLEFAAKAAGIHGEYVENLPLNGAYRTGIYDHLFNCEWNPLTDDGDALRLAVKLRLVIHVWDDGSYVSVAKTLPDGKAPSNDGDDWHGCDVEKDPYAATRRAITRAAAEIGKTL